MRNILLCLIMLFGLIHPVMATQNFFIRYQEHATDCTSLTSGTYYDLCFELDNQTLWRCIPTSGPTGTCTIPSQWSQVGAGGWTVKNGTVYLSNLSSNVGIGTTSTTYKLEVDGQMGVFSGASQFGFANGSAVNGDTPRITKIQMQNGVYNQDINFDLDTNQGIIGIESDSIINYFDFLDPVRVNTLELGRNGTSGILNFYAEEGLTDYNVSFTPSASQTMNTPYVMPPSLPSASSSLVSDSSGNETWTGPAVAGYGMSLSSGVFAFTPSALNTITFGSGSFTTEVFNSGGSEPTWTYGNGTTVLSNSSLAVYNSSSSRLFFNNNSFIDGQDSSGKILMGTSGLTNNAHLYWDFSNYFDEVRVSTDTSVTDINFNSIGLINTASDNSLGQTNFTGNVGIGSATPGTALDVVGTVRATNFSCANSVGVSCSGSPTNSFATNACGIVTHC